MDKIRGVTLLGVMITLLIISIIAGFSTVWFNDIIVSQRLQGAAQQVYTDLRAAQSEAIKRNNTVYVHFKKTTTDWCYGFSLNADCDCTVANSCQLDGIERTTTNDAFKGIILQQSRFAGGTEYTAFDPRNGFAQAGALKNGTVWFKSANDDQIAVILNRLGRVRFCSPTLENYSNQCPTRPSL